ncbi:MAG: protein-L-isoaspartate(D-aspartate) O-methyltransferase [Deltaproteobacteria bacterium]|nr:protein-L-isoaspartate(D-aspartate) O-methyltransferase [Deltaproteobacteria bacterium]NND30935.1 protein-L-isoaspartate(D-aspartate) O-methyltransferase [Myxococcales bacterium]MBT8463835.1 protein-L-isoaspartate(D-aspartate) O-methyltransferase [Deltaproteobacteria bacterium]NNK06849.1 protein-L-isoaspartate(D-aspartate) O-methyltransferase [Myxococcales bacterium]NNK44692.1 protein-L-isoaspartate(D-aspartate) O-methyltransferase [Myxococcales bacterium]
MRKAAWVGLLVVAACGHGPGRAHADRPAPEAERQEMVRTQIEARGVRDPAVLDAMRTVPRHHFVPHSQRANAYADRPLPIGSGQTISQPYIVALMTELAGVKPGDKVLEVGTGSGYQAAVLAEMGVRLFSIEIVEALATSAKATLEEHGYMKNVELRHGDGYVGWPEQAPFDAIIVTAAPPSVPKPLKAQLKVGGRLIIPVGKRYQSLLRVTRTKDAFRGESVIPVRFVPMTGEAQAH